MGIIKSFLIAAILALVIEASISGLCSTFGHIGGDGPDMLGYIGLATYIPGIIISDSMKYVGTKDTIVIVTAGYIQWLLLCWIAIAIRSRIKRQK